MVFSGATFLFLFLPSVLAAYFLLPGIRLRNLLLLTGSLFFYTWGEAQYVVVLLVSIFSNAALGRRISNASGSRKSVLLFIAIAINLILLAYFKYANFLLNNFNELIGLAGFEAIQYKQVHLPLGISFFTFQAISYVVDIYRGHAKVQTGYTGVALYISLFPQLIAGPIVRYNSVAEQLENRSSTLDDVSTGARRFVIGLAKKLLIANTLGQAADGVFETAPDQLTVLAAWFGVICYAMQIYFDFSGYSDMAIGLGRIFGFRFPENFNYPYVSKSIQEFWRRWHISLSTWFRDYVYIPLGGSKGSAARTYFNLVLVFFLCGFWHGASWNFIVWGLFHGMFLVFERIGLTRVLQKLPMLISHAYVILVVLISWVFFRADDLPHALTYIQTMFGFNHPDATLTLPFFANTKIYLTLIIALILSLPVGRYLIYAGLPEQPQWNVGKLLVSDSVLIGFLILCGVVIAGGTFDPFIYFRF